MTDPLQGAPPAQTDHDRVMSSGAAAGATAVVLTMCAADYYIPHWAAFTVNWAIILGTCGGIAVYKARWYGWAAFWALAAICLTSVVLHLLGAGRSLTVGLIAGSVMAVIFYWLIRMPRWCPEPVTRTEHHVFHHVIPDGVTAPALTATTTRATPPPRNVIAGRALRAITTAPRTVISALPAAREKQQR